MRSTDIRRLSPLTFSSVGAESTYEFVEIKMAIFNGSLLAIVIAVAFFDFTNGFHDAVDMVATAIAWRAMTPGNQQ